MILLKAGSPLGSLLFNYYLYLEYNERMIVSLINRLKITTFNGNEVRNQTSIAIDTHRDYDMAIEDSRWNVLIESTLTSGQFMNEHNIGVEFRNTQGSVKNANISVEFEFENWNKENYVLAPAAVYNGNRFRVAKKGYPPMLHTEDSIGENMETTITDVPHLNSSGNGTIELLSGDMATPSYGIYFKDKSKGMLIYSIHKTETGYTGLIFREEGDKACVEIQAPGVRGKMYQMTDSGLESDDKGYDFKEGNCVKMHLKVISFECHDVCELFRVFWETRKCMNEPVKIENSVPFSKAFEIIEQKFIATQWNEKYGYFMIAPHGQGKYGDWQAGWVGGGLNSLPFLADGGERSEKMAEQTLTTVFSKLQTSNGYIFPIMYEGKLLGDDYCHQEKTEVLLLRKNADVLAYGCRHIYVKQAKGQVVPELWMDGIKKLADTFVRLWKKHGQFGQFVNINNDEIYMGGTASAGIAVAGLALCGRLFGDKEYITVAESAADLYYCEYLCKGLLNGGPGEILQCPDSESAFGLLDGYVTLYEVTSDKKWLDYAQQCAYQCSSWCVSYDFDFPEYSEFGRLEMKTTGSVFANVQNKHSAPGICTLSPVALLKLFRYTGDERYLKLCFEIAHNVVQYLSREDRPIISWDGEVLPPGWMSERVNMSDWEGKKTIGGVFKGSCWCEISTLMTFVDIPGVWFNSDTGEIFVFDHVSTEVTEYEDKWILDIRNDTKFDAAVKLYVENEAQKDSFWGEAALVNCPIVQVQAYGSQQIKISKNH